VENLENSGTWGGEEGFWFGQQTICIKSEFWKFSMGKMDDQVFRKKKYIYDKSQLEKTKNLLHENRRIRKLQNCFQWTILFLFLFLSLFVKNMSRLLDLIKFNIFVHRKFCVVFQHFRKWIFPQKFLK
jgi:hypothetical protein